MGEGQPSDSDVDNALVVYGELSQLTPHQASIERMWAHMCHFECPKYVATRWLKVSDPKIQKEAARTKLEITFFAGGTRALIRDNGVSRLWWLGKTAADIAPEDPRKFLTILLYRQDVRSALIERPSISMNKRLLRRNLQRHAGALARRKEAFRAKSISLVDGGAESPRGGRFAGCSS